MLKRPLFTLGLASLLTACGGGDDSAPPIVSIISPAAGSPVSGTATVQVSAADDVGVSRVKLFVKGQGSEGDGVQVGSTTQGPPYVISWYTPGQPNFASLDLVAVAEDSGSNESPSDPVEVRVQNGGVPSLQLLTAFTLPPDTTVGAQKVGLAEARVPSSLLATPAEVVLPPDDIDLANVALHASLEPQQIDNRDTILEWQWEPYTSGADGYGVYLADKNLAGPYALQGRFSATAGTGAQKHSRPIEARAGDQYFGTVTAVTNSASSETGFSNADSATFLPPQSSTAPTNDTTVSNGRPTLTWTGTPGAAGYLYYLYDKNPWEDGATLLWGNFPKSTSALNVAYPSDREPLASGTYYWWVAGISFDVNGKADAFTFSEPKRLVVP